MSDFATLQEMGFPEDKITMALKKTNNSGLQAALDWLEQNPNYQEDDQTAEETDQDRTANSLKCDDCGKLLRNTDSAQLHATRTSHTNFSQSTEAIKPLTEEEKKEKLQELKEKLATKRAAKEEMEKAEAKERERIRRLAGKDMTKAKEELQEKDMKAALAQKKREKEEDKLARARIKAQIEEDKRARAQKFAEEKLLREGKSVNLEPKKAVPAEVKVGDYDETRIQIRVQGSSPITRSFKADAKFQELLDYLQSQGLNGTLVMNYPKKSFGPDDGNKSFKELGLVPSSALVLQK